MWNGSLSPGFAKAGLPRPRFPEGWYVEDDNPSQSGTIVVKYSHTVAIAIEGTEEDFERAKARNFNLTFMRQMSSLVYETVFVPDFPEDMRGDFEPREIDGSFEVKGVISSAQTDTYQFYGTYEDWEAFVASGFSKAWLMKFGMNNRQGEWGWPWGREDDVDWIDEIGQFRIDDDGI